MISGEGDGISTMQKRRSTGHGPVCSDTEPEDDSGRGNGLAVTPPAAEREPAEMAAARSKAMVPPLLVTVHLNSTETADNNRQALQAARVGHPVLGQVLLVIFFSLSITVYLHSKHL